MTKEETRLDPATYLEHLARESARFGDVLGAAAPDVPVPTCPGWIADDLLWHLAEVQWFWGSVVRERVTDGAEVERFEATRPADRAELMAFSLQAGQDLLSILTATPPRTEAWTWADDDHTVGFILRRQAHEALIHRVDAEVTAGTRSPIDPRLAADGVDEALRVMFGVPPGWARSTVDDAATVRVRCTDTGHSWVVSLGAFSGTSPNSGTTYEEEPFLQVARMDDGRPAVAGIAGAAADVDCWLWNRPAVGPVELAGDPGVLHRFTAFVAAGVQ
jgi:uncharacterized protein (TIGR03083 family)